MKHVFLTFLVDIKEEYDIGPTDVLRYLKDHTDVRTRHSAYGKSQTIAAVLTAIAMHGQDMEPSVLLFRVYYLIIIIIIFYSQILLINEFFFQALDSERLRLYSVCKESRIQPLGEGERLLHFGVYLLANQVDFEPFIYWSLLQHFASFSLLVEERFD